MPSKRLQRVTVKQNFKSNEIILHVENYKNQQQHEVQSAYFGHSSFALFTACCYLRSMDGSLIKESLVVVTESPDYSRTLREKYFPAFGLNKSGKIRTKKNSVFGHFSRSGITAYSCFSKAVTYIREKYQELPLKLTLYVWSDYCATQLRSCYVFSLMSCYDCTLNISWFYNEHHHGKGTMDGVGGTVKNVVFRDAKSGKCRINSPKEIAEYAFKRV